MKPTKHRLILASPFLIGAVNILVAIVFGQLMGKWAFLPLILIEWCLFIFFIRLATPKERIKKWLAGSQGSFIWTVLAILIGCSAAPIFLQHYTLLNHWTLIMPWLLIAFINPFMEEMYWRGLLLDTTSEWKNSLSIIVTSLLFAANHYVFAINTDLFKGFPVFISTFIMGIIWAIIYKKTKSLRWTIFSHFLVDLLNLSVPSFLDLYQQAW